MSQDIRIKTFGADDALSKLSNNTRQIDYLKCYLEDLKATSVIEESKYFDRDYLSEFSAFYSVSSKPYPNTCERLHFFSVKISRENLRKAAGGSQQSLKKLQDSYLGFVILRPILAAPLGRSVLKWYSDDGERGEHTPRVINPSRKYSIHLAGFELHVIGLAWQQQDTAVAACATVSLWSMLHSSAFDDHHAIPTTAEITRAAHTNHSFGSRVFPSQGLNIYQICDAIKEQALAPLITAGDICQGGFSRERFSSTCAAYIRSGYPIMLIGHFLSEDDVGHAICVVGFRSSAPDKTNLDTPGMAESNIEYLYIHDDNLGPNVRFKIDAIPVSEEPVSPERVVLSTSEPCPRNSESYPSSPTRDYQQFLPTQLIVAAHNNIRTSPDTLHTVGLRQATLISSVIKILKGKFDLSEDGLAVSSRFIKLASYLGDELSKRLGSNRKILSRVRLELSEKVDPMSLHIGLIRISLDDSTPLLDVLYDTTDSDRNHPVYCHISYSLQMTALVEVIQKAGKNDFGRCVKAY